MIDPRSSDTARTKDTAKYIAEQSPAKRKGDLRLRKNLAFEYDPESEFMKEIIRIKNDIIGEDYESISKEEFNKRLHKASAAQADYYLSFRDQRPDSKALSPIETASGIAKVVSENMEEVDEIDSGSNVDFINGTHDFNLVAFLKEVMIREVDGRKVEGFESIEEIGGPMGFTENFEVLIRSGDDGKKSVKLLFRGNEYEINMKRFNELVEINNNLRQSDENR